MSVAAPAPRIAATHLDERGERLQHALREGNGFVAALEHNSQRHVEASAKART